jgi:hypothetical protein
MHDSFAALLAQPSARRYKQLRSQLLASGESASFGLRFLQWEQQWCGENAGDAAEDLLLDSISELLREGLLSLRLHRLAGQAMLRCGNASRAELHRFTYDRLLQAIAATGKGTLRQPLLITYPSDASELLAFHGEKAISQSLVEDRERRLDVVLCASEREYWFDVTDLLPLTAIAARRSRRPSAATAVGAPQRKKPVRARV